MYSSPPVRLSIASGYRSDANILNFTLFEIIESLLFDNVIELGGLPKYQKMIAFIYVIGIDLFAMSSTKTYLPPMQ